MAQTLDWTYADFRRLPEDGTRYEVLAGCLVREPAPTEPHQAIVRDLMAGLYEALDDEEWRGVYTAPLAVVLDEHDVVQPDLVYVAPGRRGIVRRDGLHGAPDLVIEVLSPSTRHRDLIAKQETYALAGVREYVIVDRQRRRLYQLTDPRAGRYARRRELTATDVLTSAGTPAWHLRASDLLPAFH